MRAAILFFAAALFFRYADDMPRQLMPMGVHWLWHLFCAAGAMALGRYLMLYGRTRQVQENGL